MAQGGRETEALREAALGLSRALSSNVRLARRQLERSVAPLPLAHSGPVLSEAASRLAQSASAAAAGALSSFLAGDKERPPRERMVQAGVPVDRVLCVEVTRGKRRTYRRGGSGSSLVFEDEEVTHRHRLHGAFADYLLPQGFPDSVAPQYAAYMGWRGVQYFFGGAMSVFTTRALLGALGVANRGSGEAAAAINWVLKDGAGRLGRFLFARWGRQLDCELKQFRLAGDGLMEAGAVLELATALAPRAFLPLACTANLAKNLAAVAASATRAPIYRTFALSNNLADVTAKGESVANLADILGTAFGIALARCSAPLVPTFAALSMGYVLASRREVDAVVLPYLNRARLSYCARAFWEEGRMPGPEEGNAREKLLPWNDRASARIVLGANVAEACEAPAELDNALTRFRGRQYALTYRPSTRKVYVLLRASATADDALAGALDAHALLCMLDRCGVPSMQPFGSGGGGSAGRAPREVRALHRAADRLRMPGGAAGGDAPDGEAALAYVARHGSSLRGAFRRDAAGGGWRLHMTMLNPRETRLCLA